MHRRASAVPSWDARRETGAHPNASHYTRDVAASQSARSIHSWERKGPEGKVPCPASHGTSSIPVPPNQPRALAPPPPPPPSTRPDDAHRAIGTHPVLKRVQPDAMVDVLLAQRVLDAVHEPRPDGEQVPHAWEGLCWVAKTRGSACLVGGERDSWRARTGALSSSRAQKDQRSGAGRPARRSCSSAVLVAPSVASDMVGWQRERRRVEEEKSPSLGWGWAGSGSAEPGSPDEPSLGDGPR